MDYECLFNDSSLLFSPSFAFFVCWLARLLARLADEFNEKGFSCKMVFESLAHIQQIQSTIYYEHIENTYKIKDQVEYFKIASANMWKTRQTF